MPDRIGARPVFPSCDVGEVLIVADGFAPGALVLLAEMGPAGFLPGQGIAQHQLGQVVVAWLEGGFTLKRLVRHRGRWRLEAAHPAYPPLELAPSGRPQIWGVALHVIRTHGA